MPTPQYPSSTVVASRLVNAFSRPSRAAARRENSPDFNRAVRLNLMCSSSCATGLVSGPTKQVHRKQARAQSQGAVPRG